MPKLKSVTRREFIKKLQHLGLEGPVQGGDHQFMIGEQCKIKIPNPHSQKDIPSFVIQLTIKTLGITREEWENA